MSAPVEFIPLNPETWERKEYFDYFYYQIKCKYTLNANIDISGLLENTRKLKLKFFPTFLYAIMRIINQNKEFRMSFDKEGNLGYWNYVVPSYTIFHEDTKTFSDIWSDYTEDYSSFYYGVLHDMETYKNVKAIKGRPDQPVNFCSISSLPWLSFTNYSQDTYTESPFLFPLIRFGKYFTEGEKILIPFAIFVNHAVADGYHTAKLINDLQSFVTKSGEWINT